MIQILIKKLGFRHKTTSFMIQTLTIVLALCNNKE